MYTIGQFYFIKFDNSAMTSITDVIFQGEYLVKVKEVDDNIVTMYIVGFGNINIPVEYILEADVIKDNLFTHKHILRARDADLLKQPIRKIGKHYTIYGLFDVFTDVEILTFVNGDILFKDKDGLVRVMQSYMCKRIEWKGENNDWNSY